jgi:hypothetical protein
MGLIIGITLTVVVIASAAIVTILYAIDVGIQAKEKAQ